jgi:uncharacterized coiled-coil DUF342 family protein
MLKEIWSNKFISNGKIRDKIEFNDNLNVVLGADDAANSIGKSTFLMALDFAFCGKDYVEKTNVIDNVDHHFISFKFIFNETAYYFSRSTEDLNNVIVCDSNYSEFDIMPIEDYKSFLFEMYGLNLPHTSFRNVVSRYLRIYGRDNSNEKRPLHGFPNEKSGVPVNSLIKLFNKYDTIETYQSALNEVNEIKNAHKKAQKYTLIPKITKTKYNENIKEIRVLELELEQIQYAKEDLLASSDKYADDFVELKRELSRLKRQRTSLYNELNIVNRDIKMGSSQNNYDVLSRFFENANIKHLDEINNFHSRLYEILRNEFDEAKTRIQINIENISDEIKGVEQQIKTTGYSQTVPKTLVMRISEISNKIRELRNENNQYDKSSEFKDDSDKKKANLTEVRKDIVKNIAKTINEKMDAINDLIYHGEKTPPRVTFHDNNDYKFEVINDSGTGSRYRGMLIYDIVILQETVLPILIHDSFLYKNIEDHAIEVILEDYTSVNKQVFISLDKIGSYSENAQKILKTNEVIYLSPGGNELFGWAWNKKELNQQQ